MSTKVKKILTGLVSFCQLEAKTRHRYLVNPSFFTRQRKLSFARLCFFCLVSPNGL